MVQMVECLIVNGEWLLVWDWDTEFKAEVSLIPEVHLLGGRFCLWVFRKECMTGRLKASNNMPVMMVKEGVAWCPNGEDARLPSED